ncbi:MAG: hypothetical protein LBH44_07500 [Treponema sp.]|jgi:hypothetical protein|nr:hypothetical protein [Treponema sp.]
MTEIQKQKMIKLIHTQKTLAGIDDETYICILMGAANVQSSLYLETIQQFSDVITALNNLLIAQGKTIFGGSLPPVSRDVYPLVKRAERILGPNADKRLGGFIRKFGKKSVNDLSPFEIRKCHGFLTRLEQEGVRK